MVNKVFFPSQTQPWLVGLVQRLSPVVGRLGFRLEVQIRDEDLAKIRALGEARWVLMPNHPTFDDGLCLFRLSARLGEAFNFMVAYENFRGYKAKLLPWLGAYSIQRGLGDRASLAHTIDLLKRPRCRMVIFPEGGCSFQNDEVTPFRSGAIQLPFQALGQLHRQTGEVPPFYLIPVSLKYHYPQPMDRTLDRILGDLETALAIPPGGSPEDFYPRLRAIAAVILQRIEAIYPQVAETGDRDWNDRIETLRQGVVEQCEQTLEITPPPQMPLRERVYRIQAVLADEADRLPEDQWQHLHRSTTRLLNFDAIYDGYVGANPTPERFLDTLIRLEREVYDIDIPKPKAHHVGHLSVGDPINLQDYWIAYKENKSATVEQLTQRIQGTVQGNLNRLSRQLRPQEK